ncbi:homeobox-leucine zipper family protein /lipid-binding START domain-containing protein [Striga asiatica]|uniref:Homeobox-leucine zipper family protein /lipid-binding START domain-containing protein n=1 Tax=Striga asiatica TaxID=4170 RepID=A0A5A7P2C4_STRAF|nr:homeobox-leucine zipper family protein /lipid-binding START domain-containing protein [Striga asiatica]
MNSGLTELEMGAVLELIQLSGGGGGFPVLWVDFSAEKDGSRDKRSEEEKSAGESFSSSASSIVSASGEALPRRRKRFRSLADIYLKTRPLVKNRVKKRAGF